MGPHCQIAARAARQPTLILLKRTRRRFMSTRPEMPGTVPELVYCQIDQPRPAQFEAGTSGALTSKFATQSG